MKKILLLLLYLLPLAGSAQQYWVFYRDKGQSTIDTSAFDAHVRSRRRLQAIPWDEKDAPVDLHYISTISRYVDSTGYSSRWLNATLVYGNDAQLEQVRSLPFVQEVLPVAATPQLALHPAMVPGGEVYKLARYQTQRLGASVFRERHISGKGVRIAIIDAGFFGADKHPAFGHIRQRKGILKTYDFIRKKEDVYLGSQHGTMVFSCIAGIGDSLQLGLAPDAEFLLARTEYLWADTHNDEDRWIAALEWAEQNGADLVNSSLGYTGALHLRSQLNGKLPIDRAANIAAAKGMLIISAAGNEYNNGWKYITIPGDADSVLTVGATDPYSDLQTSFSSIGPTADGRLKPNVCAPGVCAVIDGIRLVKAEGTSFATPLVTGYAACLLQLSGGTLHAVQLKNAIEHSGHLYPYFDYCHGYGIPQAGHYPIAPPASKNFTLQQTDRDFSVVPYPGAVKDSNDYKLLFVHIQGRSGRLRLFRVIELNGPGPVSLDIRGISREEMNDEQLSYFYDDNSDLMKDWLFPGETLRIHLEGYTEEYFYTAPR